MSKKLINTLRYGNGKTKLKLYLMLGILTSGILLTVIAVILGSILFGMVALLVITGGLNMALKKSEEDIQTTNFTSTSLLTSYRISKMETRNSMMEMYDSIIASSTDSNQIISKEQIYDKIWGIDNYFESNNLEAYLSFVRKKLKIIDSDVTIKAIRGMGYKLEV